MILPWLFRLEQLGRTEEGSLRLVSEFLVQQQQASSPDQVLSIAYKTLQQFPAVGTVLLRFRIPPDTMHLMASLPAGVMKEALIALLDQRKGERSLVEVVDSLRQLHPRLPERGALLVHRSLPLLRGPLAYAILDGAVLSKERDGFSGEEIQILSMLLEQTALFLESLERRAYNEQVRTAQKEQDFLRETREALLPPPPPILKSVDFHVYFEPYDPGIGGDYYQIYEHTDRAKVDFWLSDCAGHGIAAAYQMAQARACLNTLWMENLPPDKLIFRLNDALKRLFHKNNFITATLLHFDLERKEYILFRAGSPDIFLWDPLTGKAEILRPSGIVLGNASSQIISRIIVPERGRLVPGSLFLFFSDGITEAKNEQGEMFGTERLFNLFSIYYKLPLEDIADRILETLRAFTGGGSLGDDGTLVLVRYTG